MASMKAAKSRAVRPEAGQALAGRVAALWHRAAVATGGPNDNAFCPSADELRRMRAEASRREARALLHMALLL